MEERAQKWAENCEFEHSKQEFRNFSGENLYARWENHELPLGIFLPYFFLALTPLETLYQLKFYSSTSSILKIYFLWYAKIMPKMMGINRA